MESLFACKGEIKSVRITIFIAMSKKDATLIVLKRESPVEVSGKSKRSLLPNLMVRKCTNDTEIFDVKCEAEARCGHHTNERANPILSG